MNAPLYATPEPALADAYRTTARAVRREQNREAFIDAAYRDALSALTGNATTTAYWECRLVAPIWADLVAWVMETSDDPTTTLGNALAAPALAGVALRERYALARAEAKALEQERNGIDWTEA